MGQVGDDRLSLPDPPPPRPAARHEAIQAALRKFDGIEDAPARRPRRSLAQWAYGHKVAAGGLVTAALVAIISIPAIQVVLSDHPAEVASEDSLSRRAPAFGSSAEESIPAEQPATPAGGPTATEGEPKEARAEPPAVADHASLDATAERAEKARVASPAPVVMPMAPVPVMAAPPAPPPPPPPAPVERAAQAAGADNIVVSGSRIGRANLESVAPVTVVDPENEFLTRLRAALAANDRRAVIGLVGFPLRVNWESDGRTYRSVHDVERDYDRIFSARVRQSIVGQRPDAAMGRQKGGLNGNGRIWFGRVPDGSIRIREINP